MTPNKHLFFFITPILFVCVLSLFLLESPSLFLTYCVFVFTLCFWRWKIYTLFDFLRVVGWLYLFFVQVHTLAVFHQCFCFVLFIYLTPTHTHPDAHIIKKSNGSKWLDKKCFRMNENQKGPENRVSFFLFFLDKMNINLTQRHTNELIYIYLFSNPAKIITKKKSDFIFLGKVFGKKL